MIPTTTLFTKTRNRRRHFMKPRSNPDFMHGDFEMFSRVWRSIESLFLTSGLRKNYAREVGIRSVPQYQISPNFLFWGLLKGGRTRKIGHYAKIRYGRGKDMLIFEITFFRAQFPSDVRKMTFSCRVQRKSRDRKKFSILMHNLSTAKVFCEWSRNRGGVAQKFLSNR